MNCREAEPLLLAERDREIDPAQRAALAAHVGACASCRHVQQTLGAAALAWRAADSAVSTPVIETEWHAIRRRIRNAESGESRTVLASRPFWWGVATATAALILASVMVPRWWTAPVDPVAKGWTYVSYVEVDDDSGSTMIYEDAESGWLVVWVGDGPGVTGS